MEHLAIDTIPRAAKVGFSAEQAGSSAYQAIDRVSEAVHPAVSHATSGAHHLVDRISGTTSKVAQRLEKTTTRLKDTEQRLVGAGSDYVREHPLKSAGIALAAGFLVSQLVNSRKSPESQLNAGMNL